MRIKTTYRKEKNYPSASNIDVPLPVKDESMEQQEEIDSNYRKRMILSECIDEIYMISGMNLPQLQPAINGKKSVISRNINLLLKSQTSTSLDRNKMIRARRQLFREQRTNVRKQHKQKCRKLSNMSTSISHYRSIRSLIRKKRVRRNIMNDINFRILQNRTNKELSDELYNADTCVAANVTIDSECTEDASEVEQDDYEELEPYESDVEKSKEELEHEAALMRTQIWAEQQYNIAMGTNDKIMEETLRTVYYLKTLSSLMCY